MELSEKASGLDSLSPYRVQWPESRAPESEVRVGIVQSGDTVCHVSVAATPKLLALGLTEYIRKNAPYQLSAGDARRVEELVGRGHHQQAVDHYFGGARHRWGRERLVVRRIELTTGPVAVPRGAGTSGGEGA